MKKKCYDLFQLFAHANGLNKKQNKNCSSFTLNKLDIIMHFKSNVILSDYKPYIRFHYLFSCNQSMYECTYIRVLLL